jgi:hypothetical protein
MYKNKFRNYRTLMEKVLIDNYYFKKDWKSVLQWSTDVFYYHLLFSTYTDFDVHLLQILTYYWKAITLQMSHCIESESIFLVLHQIFIISKNVSSKSFRSQLDTFYIM